MARALSLTISLNENDVRLLDAQRAEVLELVTDKWDTDSWATRRLVESRSGAALLFMRRGFAPAAPARKPAASKPSSRTSSRKVGKRKARKAAK